VPKFSYFHTWGILNGLVKKLMLSLKADVKSQIIGRTVTAVYAVQIN
jgi:hypothetical protein